ncbi:MAG: PAS domain S-box protein [Melioribacteraceae bacterium]|nr:PAS domain S-box protein [Melioribacteraceae bacterium]
MSMFQDMNINKLTLSFKDNIENEYQAYYFKDSLNVFRFALIVVAFLYGIFGLLDVAVAPEHKNLFFLIRYAFVIPFLLIVFSLSFFNFFKKIWQWLLFMSFIIGGFGIILMIVRMPENVTYYAGLMLVFSAGYFFVKLRFILATLGGWITLAIFFFAVLFFSETPYNLIIAYTFFYISANVISMFAAYYIEYFNRRNFILTNQLNQKKIELEEVNKNLESQVKARTLELETSEKKFRTLVERASDIIFSMTSEGTFIYVSPNWKEILGHEISDVQGKQFIDFIHHDDINKFSLFLGKLIESDKSVNYLEYRVKHNNGGWRWHVSSLTPQFDPEGKVDSFIGIAHDISERKKAENAIIESQRLSAIGEMASAVAHDFNNSLQVIFGNLDVILLDKSIPPQLKNYLETIKTSATDASARVQLLQRFSGKKQSTTRYNKVDLNKIVKDVIIQSRPLWKDRQEEKGLEIIIETHYGEIHPVYGNEGELRSVIYNLVKNSIEAMPYGGTIIFETGSRENGLFVHITDTGTGMDEETKTRVFQPFFTTKGFEIGRGLGMSGAYSIIQEHKGELKVVRSSPGKGTTIEVLLPFCNDESESDDIKTVNEFTGSARVLWVDDEPMIREIASELLDALGHKGTMVSSGMEALEMLDKEEFDLVITDIGMPRMSGWQLSDKINEKFDGKIKIAALTGWGNQFDEGEKNEHNIDFILTKPIKINELKSLIDKAMQLVK